MFLRPAIRSITWPEAKTLRFAVHLFTARPTSDEDSLIVALPMNHQRIVFVFSAQNARNFRVILEASMSE
jgi:hypothetical protein